MRNNSFQQQQLRQQQQQRQQYYIAGGVYHQAQRLRREQERLRAERQRLASCPPRFYLGNGSPTTGPTRPQLRQQFYSVPPQAKSGCLGSVVMVVGGILLLSALL